MQRLTLKQRLVARGYFDYTAIISLDQGITERTYVRVFNCLGPVIAAERALKEIRIQNKFHAGTLLMYRTPSPHLSHTQSPNGLEMVLDFKRGNKELYIVPWALHAKRIAPQWTQPSLF